MVGEALNELRMVWDLGCCYTGTIARMWVCRGLLDIQDRVRLWGSTVVKYMGSLLWISIYLAISRVISLFNV